MKQAPLAWGRQPVNATWNDTRLITLSAISKQSTAPLLRELHYSGSLIICATIGAGTPLPIG
jgi:hypothetical protein